MESLAPEGRLSRQPSERGAASTPCAPSSPKLAAAARPVAKTPRPGCRRSLASFEATPWALAATSARQRANARSPGCPHRRAVYSQHTALLSIWRAGGGASAERAADGCGTPSGAGGAACERRRYRRSVRGGGAGRVAAPGSNAGVPPIAPRPVGRGTGICIPAVCVAHTLAQVVGTVPSMRRRACEVGRCYCSCGPGTLPPLPLPPAQPATHDTRTIKLVLPPTHPPTRLPQAVLLEPSSHLPVVAGGQLPSAPWVAGGSAGLDQLAEW